MKIKLTYELAQAAGWDAGNASMRRGGRTKWSQEDWDEAAKVSSRLFAEVIEQETKEGEAAP